MELQLGKRRAFPEDELVSLLADLALKPSWQTILELKDPRDLAEDLVFFLMEGGRPLTVVEDIRPIFRAYTPASGHVCETNQAEDYRGGGGFRDGNISLWEISYFKCVQNFPLNFQAAVRNRPGDA